MDQPVPPTPDPHANLSAQEQALLSRALLAGLQVDALREPLRDWNGAQAEARAGALDTLVQAAERLIGALGDAKLEGLGAGSGLQARRAAPKGALLGGLWLNAGHHWLVALTRAELLRAVAAAILLGRISADELRTPERGGVITLACGALLDGAASLRSGRQESMLSDLLRAARLAQRKNQGGQNKAAEGEAAEGEAIVALTLAHAESISGPDFHRRLALSLTLSQVAGGLELQSLAGRLSGPSIDLIALPPATRVDLLRRQALGRIMGQGALQQASARLETITSAPQRAALNLRLRTRLRSDLLEIVQAGSERQAAQSAQGDDVQPAQDPPPAPPGPQLNVLAHLWAALSAAAIPEGRLERAALLREIAAGVWFTQRHLQAQATSGELKLDPAQMTRAAWAARRRAVGLCGALLGCHELALSLIGRPSAEERDWAQMLGAVEPAIWDEAGLSRLGREAAALWAAPLPDQAEDESGDEAPGLVVAGAGRWIRQSGPAGETSPHDQTREQTREQAREQGDHPWPSGPGMKA